MGGLLAALIEPQMKGSRALKDEFVTLQYVHPYDRIEPVVAGDIYHFRRPRQSEVSARANSLAAFTSLSPKPNVRPIQAVKVGVVNVLDWLLRVIDQPFNGNGSACETRALSPRVDQGAILFDRYFKSGLVWRNVVQLGNKGL